MSLDMEEQYDKIYRYCFFKLHNRELAEDMTQETFLRYLQRYSNIAGVSALKCLYTIARNLCVEEYRRPKYESVEASESDGTMEERLIEHLAVKKALSSLASDEQELLLLRYVNEVPVSTIAGILGISRFAVYRKLKSAAKQFREAIREEDSCGSVERTSKSGV